MNEMMRDRYRGCLLGLAVGDAVGTAAEFKSRDSFAKVKDMVGGGPFHLKPGEWTDDTSMALCLAESLLAHDGFHPRDQMNRYLRWWRSGYLSATGACFDIGTTVRDALARFERTGEPYCGSEDPGTAGNGSLMRLAPVPLFYYPEMDQVIEFSARSSRTTHGAPEAVESCQLLGFILGRCLAGESKTAVLDASTLVLDEPQLVRLAGRAYVGKRRDEVRGSGYAVDSLEAALWCFETTDSFEAAVLEAVNLGEDADTTGAIVGQIAGAFYGGDAIPTAWLEKLAMRDVIERFAQQLFERARRIA